MNLVERFVLKIHHVSENAFGYTLIADIDDYGRVEKEKIIRVSKPGLRQYRGVATMPRVLNGLGIAILSTSKGIITDKEAKTLNVGGEVLCYVY